MSDPFDRALRAAARRSRPAGVCPDAAMLASYADNGLLEDERRGVEAHAADCATCLEHLALLGAVSVDREAPEPSRSWLAHWGWLVPVATAVLVVAVWIRLPEQKASQDVPAATAPASQARAPVASEQERAAAASPSAGRDEASNAAPRVAAKVSKASPARPAPPADAKFDQLKPLERRDDDARQKAAAASPPRVPATVAAPAQKEALEGRRAVGQASAQAAPPAAQAPALADAVKRRSAGRRFRPASRGRFAHEQGGFAAAGRVRIAERGVSSGRQPHRAVGRRRRQLARRVLRRPGGLHRGWLRGGRALLVRHCRRTGLAPDTRRVFTFRPAGPPARRRHRG